MLSRRRFVTLLAATVPAAALVRRAHVLSVDAIAGQPAPGLPARTLHALGDAVLPQELGAGGVRRAVEHFQQWIAGYREHAELVHGYGTSRLAYAGPTPATRWARQLDELERNGREGNGGVTFTRLSREDRQRMVRDAVRRVQPDPRGDALPSVVNAPHVALALLAHFYASPAATDLCYEARIGRQTCRPLAQSPRKPLPLA